MDIPLETQMLNHMEKNEPSRPMTTTSQKRILVVDDDETFRLSLQELLEQDGYVCQVAENGMKAFAELMRADVDLVIADYDMPKMNGLQLLECMKDHHGIQSTPFILISGKLDPTVRDQAQQHGASAIFTKPYNYNELLKKILQLLPCPQLLN